MDCSETAVAQFMQRLDQAIDGLLVQNMIAIGNVHGYNAERMGPRYSFVGRNFPLSVFRGEGEVLFRLTQELQPMLTVECYTGTGYSSACLAAGYPSGEVLSVDNYSEGDVGDYGWEAVQTLRDRLGLANLRLVRGGLTDLSGPLGTRQADLVFLDGPTHELPVPLKSSGVLVTHDISSRAENEMMVEGGSWMKIHCDDPATRDRIRALLDGLLEPARAA